MRKRGIEPSQTFIYLDVRRLWPHREDVWWVEIPPNLPVSNVGGLLTAAVLGLNVVVYWADKHPDHYPDMRIKPLMDAIMAACPDSLLSLQAATGDGFQHITSGVRTINRKVCVTPTGEIRVR